MLERQIEEKLRIEIKKMGGLAYKFVSPGNIGVPDRIVILPTGKVWFVELKTENGRLTPSQSHQIDRLMKLGGNVCVLYGNDEVNRFLTVCRREVTK